jgi:hypothetical protein
MSFPETGSPLPFHLVGVFIRSESVQILLFPLEMIDSFAIPPAWQGCRKKKSILPLIGMP